MIDTLPRQGTVIFGRIHQEEQIIAIPAEGVSLECSV
jgi:hypothetical protein